MSGGEGAGECPSIIHLKRDCCPPMFFMPPIMGLSSSADRLPPGVSPGKKKKGLVQFELVSTKLHLKVVFTGWTHQRTSPVFWSEGLIKDLLLLYVGGALP